MPDGTSSEELGWSVAIEGNTVVGGAPWATIAGRVRQGALYVFQGGGVDWFPKVKLTADDGAASDLLGWSVGISGNRIVGGALGDDQFRGAAYVFENPGTGWENATQRARITATDREQNDNFGFATAISGGTVVSGAQTDTVGVNAQQGSAYVFRLAPSAPVVSGPASAIAGATANYTATVADGGDGGVAGIRWSVAGLPDQQGAGASYQFPAPGAYTLHVTATDAAGNESSEGTLTVQVDPVPPVDADGDGVLNTTDCDDGNAKRYPGAPDIPGNGIDENCDNVDAVVKLDPAIANKWGYARRFSIVISLKVKAVPAGATVQVRCSGPRRSAARRHGCPFVSRKYKPKPEVRTINLTRPFKGRKLWVRTVVEIRITAPGTIGKVVRYKIARNKVPPATTLCLPPGAPKPQRC